VERRGERKMKSGHDFFSWRIVLIGGGERARKDNRKKELGNCSIIMNKYNQGIVAPLSFSTMRGSRSST
jgi:hypothetical protein